MIKPVDRELFRTALWSADIDSLDLEKDRFIIIERFLEHGGDRHIDFIFKNYNVQDIIDVIKNSSYLSPRTVNYWCLFFNLKREETRCFSRQYQRLWSPS